MAVVWFEMITCMTGSYIDDVKAAGDTYLRHGSTDGGGAAGLGALDRDPPVPHTHARPHRECFFPS